MIAIEVFTNWRDTRKVLKDTAFPVVGVDHSGLTSLCHLKREKAAAAWNQGFLWGNRDWGTDRHQTERSPGSPGMGETPRAGKGGMSKHFTAILKSYLSLK